MQSAMNATGQNYGAGKPKRIRRVFYYSLLQGAGFVFALAMILFAFRPEIAGIFVAEGTHGREKIIGAVVEWMGIMLTTYFMQGVMNAVIGTVRGLGYSLSPLILNIIGTCVVRAMWIFFVFPLDMFHTFSGLAMLYPVSWTTATLMFSILIVISFRKIKRMESQERGDEELVEI
jgi:Na+-driven multidrug efflux pump